MKKNIVQDVIPPKRSIRDVELPSRTRNLHNKIPDEIEVPIHIKREPAHHKQKPPPPTPPPSYTYEYDEPLKSSKKMMYSGVAILVLITVFGVSALFKSAKITLTPKQDSKTLSETFTAKKDSTTASLAFQLVTTSKDVEKIVEATGEQEVSKKAQGRIVIYNNTNTSQKLVATTRFETLEGLIFRLIKEATIPGKSVKDGKSVAGSVEVIVEADKPGVSHNIPLKDFTIPGFKGDPKYNEIYARSKTEMSGGFVGKQKIVSKEVTDKVEKELEDTLRASLSKDLTSQIPANFVLYTSSITYDFEQSDQINGQAGSTTLKKKGTARGLIFDKGSLARAIIAKTMPSVADNLVKIVNLDTLIFEYLDSETDPTEDVEVSFTLKGELNFVWVFDENKLKSDLLGLSKKDARGVIATYGNIKEAWVETSPFWNRTIPKNSEKVTLINTLGN